MAPVTQHLDTLYGVIPPDPGRLKPISPEVEEEAPEAEEVVLEPEEEEEEAPKEEEEEAPKAVPEEGTEAPLSETEEAVEEMKEASADLKEASAESEFADLTVAEIKDSSGSWDEAKLKAALEYEQAHEQRKGAVSVLEDALSKDDGEG